MKRGLLAFLTLILTVPIILSEGVRAVEGHMVIKSVQAVGLNKNESYELIEIENQGSTPVDLTNWSIVYASASGATTKTLIKFKPTDFSTRLMLAPGASETVMSVDYANAFVQDKTALITFTSGINPVGGAVILKNSATPAVIIDAVGWGSAMANHETAPTPALTSTTLIRRAGFDTDNNAKDFLTFDQASIKSFSFGSISEVQDICSNIDGIQLTLPENMEQNEGACTIRFTPARLILSELLANPNGTDAGHEFLEIMNMETSDVDMGDYMLKINGKTYGFPDGAIIKAGEFKKWSDDDLGITFANTTGAMIELMAQATVVDTMPAYMNAPIDTSWSRFENGWQYTNQLTPEAQNHLSIDDGVDAESETMLTVAACKTGYYRNELTGRCRKIPVTYEPAACKDGQYRSEETGRCRSIAQTVAASLKPCADDQFRNPETGRCKKIASTDDIPAPCKEGYERNLETGRCRKKLLTAMPAASYPVQPIVPISSGMGVWWTLGGVAAASLGYAAWEWRSEVVRILRRVLGVISFGRR